MVCIGNWFECNQDHIWAALSALGSVGTLFFAAKALRTWQYEKQYDLKIQNLASYNVAAQFISNLRSPLSFEGEIDNEDYKVRIKELDDANESPRTKMALRAMFVYQSRKDKQQFVYEQVLKLREMNWATYGSKHEFYIFYNRIVSLDNEIRNAYITNYYNFLSEDEYGKDEFKAIIKANRAIMYELGEDDIIKRELETWRDKLERYRTSR